MIRSHCSHRQIPILRCLFLVILVQVGEVLWAFGVGDDWSGRMRSISMHRDYSDVGGGVGTNTAIGLQLHHEKPLVEPIMAGFTYDLVGELHRSGDSGINLNDDIRILTEAWLRWAISDSCDLTFGRQTIDGEVLRADPFRHKSRSVEAIHLEWSDVHGCSLSFGHAFRLSNWLQFRDWGRFQSFDHVFKSDDSGAGMTWAELVCMDANGWKFALFGSQVHDIARLVGARAEWRWTSGSAFSAFHRHEEDERGGDGAADAFGFAWHGKMGELDLECGSFSVRGRKLLFDAISTGINHPLGALMLISESPYDKGADSGYIRIVYPFENARLYALYAYTAHGDLPFHGHELNLVLSVPLRSNWNMALKFGYGVRHPRSGADEHLSDSRVIFEYSF